MADSTKKSILIGAIDSALSKRIAEIDTFISDVQMAPNLNSVQQRADFESKVAPLLAETKNFMAELRTSKLSDFTDADLESIFAAITSKLHEQVAAAIRYFVNDRSQTQAATFHTASEIEKAYTLFFYNTDLTESNTWKWPIIDIISKRNAINLQAVPKLSSIVDSDVKRKDASFYTDKFGFDASRNLASLFICIIFLCLVVYLEYAYVFEYLLNIPIDIADNIPDHQFYLIVMKNIFNSVLFFAVFYAFLKACAVFLNNYLISREKSNTLLAYGKFFTDEDKPEVTAAATLEVIKTVLGVRDTGVFKQQESGASNQPNILQIASQVKDLLAKKD